MDNIHNLTVRGCHSPQRRIYSRNGLSSVSFFYCEHFVNAGDVSYGEIKFEILPAVLDFDCIAENESSRLFVVGVEF